MSTLKSSFVFLFLVQFAFVQDTADLNSPDSNFSSNDRELTLLDLNRLLSLKKKVRKGKNKPAYDYLIKSADSLLEDGPFSVVFKTQVPPSGDKHDYISIGPYWWPDSTKISGKPWINIDGKVNPLTRGNNTDYVRKGKLFNNVYILSVAFFLSKKEKYAKKTLELLKVWFINKDTRMNPNLDFAQGIPGKFDGRSSGVIEFSGIRNVITAIELLELENAIDNESSIAIRQWLTDYLSWLQISERGLQAKNSKNNHGTWYDVQEITLLIFLDRMKDAKDSFARVKRKRIADQIDAEGKQIWEITRTKSLHYSTFNLKAFSILLQLSTKANTNLWDFETENGSSIQKAYEFLKPYILDEKVWEYQEISNLKKAKENLRKLFGETASIIQSVEYCEIYTKNRADTPSILDQLVIDCPNE